MNALAAITSLTSLFVQAQESLSVVTYLTLLGAPIISSIDEAIEEPKPCLLCTHRILQEPCQSKVTQLSVGGSSSVAPVVASPLGTPLNPTQRSVVDDAIDLIEQWESSCPNLPTLPKPGDGKKLSEAIDEIKDRICVQTVHTTNSRLRGDASQPDGAQYTDEGKLVCLSGHPGINLNSGLLNSGSGINRSDQVRMTAFVLIHKIHHISQPTSASNRCTREVPAYTFERDWMCAFADCLASMGKDNVPACFMAKVVNEQLCECGEAQVACGSCPMPTTVNCDQGHIIPSSFRFTYQEVFFAGGEWGSAILKPVSNQLVFDLVGASGNQERTIDFNLVLPGFQATCMDVKKMFGLGAVYIGGYDVQTSQGKLIKVALDFNTSPFYSLTNLYSGSGFSAPYDIDLRSTHPNQAIVLDSTNASVVLCMLVSGNCTTLASSQQHPELTECRYVAIWDINIGDGTVGTCIWASKYSEDAVVGNPMVQDQTDDVLILDWEPDGVPDAFD